jgi:hypothetical protein
MLMAGLDYGKSVAQIVVHRFPDGFNDQVCKELAEITDKALTTALDVYAVGGIARRYRDEFDNGYRTALRSNLAEYANSCAARAKKESAVV